MKIWNAEINFHAKNFGMGIKKAATALIIIFFTWQGLCGAGTLLIDDFEDGLIRKNPEWFDFGNVLPRVISTVDLQDRAFPSPENIGKYSLGLRGIAENWYIGGMGTLLGIDAAPFRSFDIDVYGYGENSGKLKIELYDDDDGDKAIETDKNWKPTKDDVWAKEIEINWYGWKHFSLPFHEFKNEGKGNGVFDPDFKNGSGGLVKLQLIFLSSVKNGEINCNLDNIGLR